MILVGKKDTDDFNHEIVKLNNEINKDKDEEHDERQDESLGGTVDVDELRIAEKKVDNLITNLEEIIKK